MKYNWISSNILPRWKGFAWFGWLKLRNIKNGKHVTVKASGIYIENGRNVEFKLDNWCHGDVNDYEVTHYCTRPDKEIN
jgi:hypothetical protein